MVTKIGSRRSFLRKSLLLAAAPSIFIPRLIRAAPPVFRRRGGANAVVGPAGFTFLDTGLVAYYKFDEGALQGVLVDSVSGNNLTELGSGGVANDASGKIGTARDFEANDADRFTVAEYPAIDFSGDVSFSVGCWFKLESGVSRHTAIAKFTGAGNQFQWWLQYDHSVQQFLFGLSTTGANQVEVNCTTVTPMIGDGSWNLAIGGRDADADEIWISVNNSAKETAPDALGPFNSNSNLYVGRVEDSGYMDGSLDEGFIYNRSLSSTPDIVALWKGGAGRRPPSVA